MSGRALTELNKINLSSLPRPFRGEYFEKKGHCFRLGGDFNRAKNSYLQARKYMQSAHDPYGLHHIETHLGHVERQLENFNQAKTHYEKALRLLKSVSPSKQFYSNPLTLDILTGLALCERGLCHWNKAISLFKKIDKSYSSLRDQQGLAYVRWALGSTQRFAGFLGEANKNLHSSLNLYKKLGDRGGKAFAMCALGGTLRLQGDASKSGALYQKANQIFRSLGDQFGLAYSYCGIGNSYRMRNNLKKGKKFSHLAINIYQKLGLKGPMGFVLWNLSQIDMAEKKFKSADVKLKRCFYLFNAVSDERGRAYAMIGRCLLMKLSGDAHLEKLISQAQKTCSRLKMPYEKLHTEWISQWGKSSANFHKLAKKYKKQGAHPTKLLSYRFLP